MQGISYKAAGTMANKEHTFQDQRFDDDFELNWVQFKWRNHDPQTGRFVEIDPLAEKYVYNSTYAFSENKVVAHRELEGLESEPVNKKTNNPFINAFISPSVSKSLEKMASNVNQSGSLEVSVVGGGVGVSGSVGPVKIQAGAAGSEVKMTLTPGGQSYEGSVASTGANVTIGKAGAGGGITLGKVVYAGGKVTSDYVTSGGSSDMSTNSNGSTKTVSSDGQISLGATLGIVGINVAAAPVKGVEAVLNFFEATANFIEEVVKESIPTVLGGNKQVGHN